MSNLTFIHDAEIDAVAVCSYIKLVLNAVQSGAT